MRVVFMGTPAFAVPTLVALHDAGHTIASVVTQPDRPVGRGRRLTAPPVKARALELGFEVQQPGRIKSPEALEHLREARADVIVVVGYGQIIPQTIFDLPRFGCVNVHASLLPKYRGAAPIQWAIANGETCSGITIMRIEKQLDAGDILLQRETGIGPAETAPELAERLSQLGAKLLIETLSGLEQGTIVPRKQDDSAATFAPILKREDGRIDWSLPATSIVNRVRAFEPWPGSYTSFRGKGLHIRRAAVSEPFAASPGAISAAGSVMRVCCGEGTSLLVEEVQLEGKKRMPVAEFVRGYRPKENEVLGETKK